MIDVIVPIHDAYDDLVACLASVEKHSRDYRLILIDDCSTDARIGQLFGRLSAARSTRRVLLRNERNLGFVASVNRGMESGRNDVVLLNSDTVVTRDWLDKLRRCADSDPAIGTVTPFSNNAEICSFPGFCRNNPVPSDPELINRAAENAAVPLYPEIPTAVGFCMLIRRRLIDEIGMFDTIFGKGYGEENDFSVRARAAGYRNVLCDDTFVVHAGSRSFGSHAPAMIEQNLGKVLAKHPEYMDRVRDFIDADPAEPIRNMMASQVAVLDHCARPGVLQVVHPRGGGTEKYVQELIAASSKEYRHYMLRILPDRWLLIDGNGAAPVHYECPREDGVSNGSWLRAVCSWLHIGVIHVHSLVGSGDDLLRMLEEASIPYRYSVHDMYLACPTVYLIDSKGDYCHATTDHAACHACLSKIDGLQDTDVPLWRQRYRRFLDKADRVFAPSEWARDTLQKYYPGVEVSLASPWPEKQDDASTIDVSNAHDLPNDARRHIGVLGAIGPEKGSRHVEALVARIRARRLPLRMVVVGYTDREQRYRSTDGVLIVHGPYEKREIEALLDRYGIQLLVFPTVWPETFSYTLSEGWLAGRPALVPPSGALQERVLATGAGWIMSGWPDTDAILDQLMALTSPESSDELARKTECAKSVFRENRHAAELVAKVYGDVPAPGDSGPVGATSKYIIYETACRSLNMVPLLQPVRHVPVDVPARRSRIGALFRALRG
jgi:O-antigen biosynthesis protein